MDPVLLTRRAHDILVRILKAHGNVLSEMHGAALYELLETFSEYAMGTLGGRRAFGLPTGMGKTTAICAFAAAMQQLGYRIPISVVASRAAALSTIRRDMIKAGVNEDDIGLTHSVPVVPGVVDPPTRESRLIQLVTHSRVRAKLDLPLYSMHGNQRRALMIWDESLLRSDSFSFSETSLRMGAACLGIALEACTDPVSRGLVEYIHQATSQIADALTGLRTEGDVNGNGSPVDLPYLEEPLLDIYRATVKAKTARLGWFAGELESLLTVCQEPLQVLVTEQCGGVVSIREAVPRSLQDVVILDASTPIRQLVRLDPTVISMESFEPASLKSFEAVEVHQLMAAGGRHSIEQSMREKTREAAAVSREVIDIVKANESTARAFLVFSFLPRGGFDVTEMLKRDMVQAGIDLAETIPEPDEPDEPDEPKKRKNRFEFLTWGNQEGLNGYEHCDVVIMAGVLHRSHLDLAAAVRGQTGNLREPTPSSRVRELVESEVAHVVFQGASRGSCRRIHDGKAMPMKLYLIHRSAKLRDLLDKVMPGATWEFDDPQHLPKAAAETKAAGYLGQLLAYLRGLPEGTDKVSSSKAKRALQVPDSAAEARAWSRGLDLLDYGVHGWVKQDRSLVRGSAVYGFTAI